MTARLAWTFKGRALEFMFLVGLGGVFIANAVVALLEPESFEQLVAASPAGELLGHGAWLAPAIAANDGLTGAAVIVSHRLTRARPFVLAWAGLWLFVVTLMKLTTVG